MGCRELLCAAPEIILDRRTDTGNIRIEYPTSSGFGPIAPVTPVLPPQHFDRFDRLSIVSLEKTGNNAVFTVDYVLDRKSVV